MAKLIKVDSSEELVKPENGTDFSLKELQEMVADSIEIIYLKSGELMILDGRGKLTGKKINLSACKILEENRFFGDYIVGDVLIISDDQIIYFT